MKVNNYKDYSSFYLDKSFYNEKHSIKELSYNNSELKCSVDIKIQQQIFHLSAPTLFTVVCQMNVIIINIYKKQKKDREIILRDYKLKCRNAVLKNSNISFRSKILKIIRMPKFEQFIIESEVENNSFIMSSKVLYPLETQFEF